MHECRRRKHNGCLFYIVHNRANSRTVPDIGLDPLHQGKTIRGKNYMRQPFILCQRDCTAKGKSLHYLRIEKPKKGSEHAAIHCPVWFSATTPTRPHQPCQYPQKSCVKEELRWWGSNRNFLCLLPPTSGSAWHARNTGELMYDTPVGVKHGSFRWRAAQMGRPTLQWPFFYFPLVF